MNKKLHLSKFFLIALVILFGGWGEIAHQTINTNMFKCLPVEMVEFKTWKDYIINHASDADERKDKDPNEAPKHSINLDSYPEFLLNGKITQNMDTLIILYGSSHVFDEGILPWAIIDTYNALKNYFIIRDWKSAKQTAADLGHYIGDSFMPFHTRKDKGYNELHQRFENDLIDFYSNQIDFVNKPAIKIPNIENFVFELLYRNFTYADSIIAADIFAQDLAGSVESDLYFSTLWSKSKNFAGYLFSNAANSYASLIYSAWSEAGCPPFNTTSVDEKNIENIYYKLNQNFPNPFNPTTKINYTVPSAEISLMKFLQIKVYDILGNEVATLVNEEKPAGNYEVEFSAGSCGDGSRLSSGIYFYILKVDNFTECRKMMLIK
jgi:hypothetical protein